jgi:hypothetical protein
MRCSKASIMLVIRPNSGVSVTAPLFVFLLPWGRPGRRVVREACAFLASALAVLAAFSASRRITCSTHPGNARRAWVLINDKVKKASPGTGLPYKLEKNRSRPCVCVPALVTTTSSPPRR